MWVTSQYLLSMMFLTYEIIDTRIVQLRCLNHPHWGFMAGPTMRPTQRQDGDTRVVGLAYIGKFPGKFPEHVLKLS
jgi:hypothetical protein